MLRSRTGVGVVVLFAFSLTPEALAEKLKIGDLPHIHAEIPAPEPRLTFTVPSVTGAQVVSMSHSADAYIAADDPHRTVAAVPGKVYPARPELSRREAAALALSAVEGAGRGEPGFQIACAEPLGFARGKPRRSENLASYARSVEKPTTYVKLS